MQLKRKRNKPINVALQEVQYKILPSYSLLIVSKHGAVSFILEDIQQTNNCNKEMIFRLSEVNTQLNIAKQKYFWIYDS